MSYHLSVDCWVCPTNDAISKYLIRKVALLLVQRWSLFNNNNDEHDDNYDGEEEGKKRRREGGGGLGGSAKYLENYWYPLCILCSQKI